MVNLRIAAGELVELVSIGSIIAATKYVSPKSIIRVVRKTYNKKILKNENIEILLTIGRPNFRERRFIKKCQRAGEPFPIKKIQLKWNRGKK